MPTAYNPVSQLRLNDTAHDLSFSESHAFGGTFYDRPSRLVLDRI